MGNVNFNTNILKTVDIDKTVNLDVNKDVFAFTNIQGNLATAEASADAIGGGTGEGGAKPAQTDFFRIDDFDEDQGPIADIFGGVGDTTGTQNTVVIPSSVLPPDATWDGAPPDTNIPAVASRTLFIETLGQGAPVVDPAGDVDTINPQNVLNVAFNPQAFGNAYAQYTSSVGDFDVTPLDGSDNQQILDNLTDDGVPDDFINFTINSYDPGLTAGNEDATARISVIFEDDDGDLALASAVLVSGFGNSITIKSPLAFFINDGFAAGVPGTPVTGSGGAIINLGFEDDADGDNNADGGVDFDAITSITLVIEDRPGQTDGLPQAIQTTDFFAFNDLVPELESVSGTDLQLDLVEIESFVPGEFGEGNLAETDTFAQVSPEGAFSFSESLAASSIFDLG